MRAILRKELADYFTSIRFLILFALVFGATAAGLFAAHEGIRSADLPEGFVFLGLYTTSGTVMPSLVFFISIFIPIIGIALGFDAINSERSGGTLSRLLAQPVFRDSVINGKFLAGVVTLTIMIATTMLLVSGYGLRMIGVPPNAEEIIRLFLFLVLTIAYGAFWMGLAILFSVLLRKVAASLLVSIAAWLFFGFFMLMIAPAIANSIVPVTQNSSEALQVQNAQLQQTILLLSPNTLFSRANTALLLPIPFGSLGVITASQVASMIANPLSLSQSLVLIWPYFTSLISLSVVCFAISYVLFMRQEIRAT